MLQRPRRQTSVSRFELLWTRQVGLRLCFERALPRAVCLFSKMLDQTSVVVLKVIHVASADMAHVTIIRRNAFWRMNAGSTAFLVGRCRRGGFVSSPLRFDPRLGLTTVGEMCAVEFGLKS